MLTQTEQVLTIRAGLARSRGELPRAADVDALLALVRRLAAQNERAQPVLRAMHDAAAAGAVAARRRTILQETA